MLGHDVEAVEKRGPSLEGFGVAEILEAEPHPNADRLKLCTVDTGRQRVRVVCGAANARAGLKSVFAPPGTVIPRSGAILKAAEIRGVRSEGMLCSAYELGLGEEREGIIELSPDAPVGASYRSLLGLDDPVLDIKVTPNRADCLGVYGLARDLAASGIGRLQPLAAPTVKGLFSSPIGLSIEAPLACPFFLGRHLRGVKNGPSPAWLKGRLEAVGLRPISALVDITNFITLDLNRPLHVFDAGKISGDLVVRLARAGERLRALDGGDYALDPEITVIADESGVLSLGGVIGGEASGCSEETREVFVEAALFDPIRTAETGRRLNIASEARYRFERGLDPDFVARGLEIATRLILDLCGGQASRIVAAGSEPSWRRRYVLRASRPQSLGGLALAPQESRVILERLGFAVEIAGEGDLAAEPPSWRGDIEGEADLVEEVLRVKGYDAIPAVSLARSESLPRAALPPQRQRAEKVRRTLAGRGLVEAVTFSFIAKKEARLFGGGAEQLTLENPISTDLDTMRPSLLPALLAAAKRNADRGFADTALFEVGPTYEDDTPAGQRLAAGGVRCGEERLQDWQNPAREVDLYLVKADALCALAAMGAPAGRIEAAADPPSFYHPGRAGTLRLGASRLGSFGELHPALLEELGLRRKAAAFEVFLDAVPAPRARLSPRPPKLSVFQPVERDFAFVLDRAVAAERLLSAARAVDPKLVAEVRLFDVYEGVGLPSDKKSLAITLRLEPQDRTLTEAEIEGFSKRLVAAVEKATGGVLRG